ncbi:unnamed protein product [Pleuronectes platessa]|uniref:Uncharacterized protein n=1 Tax=Pleuronectes platessa TaxID=8262 RepID=A0A9N7V7B1_PLEPL|nr:unnamed protein product [Pleuronectes platessa]
MSLNGHRDVALSLPSPSDTDSPARSGKMLPPPPPPPPLAARDSGSSAPCCPVLASPPPLHSGGVTWRSPLPSPAGARTSDLQPLGSLVVRTAAGGATPRGLRAAAADPRAATASSNFLSLHFTVTRFQPLFPLVSPALTSPTGGLGQRSPGYVGTDIRGDFLIRLRSEKLKPPCFAPNLQRAKRPVCRPNRRPDSPPPSGSVNRPAIVQQPITSRHDCSV